MKRRDKTPSVVHMLQIRVFYLVGTCKADLQASE